MSFYKMNVIKTTAFVLVATLFVVVLAGCGGAAEKPDTRVSEGVITFAASLVDTDNPIADMAPSKMTVKFKNNKTLVQMSAGMGIVTISFISDPQTKTMTQIFKMSGQAPKAVIQNEQDIQKENDSYNIEIIPTNKTKMIAGYNCKNARIHNKNGDLEDYDIYYTDEINIKNSNFANLYCKLDGVLMEYRIKKAGLEMQFVAQSVTKEDVEDTTFQLAPETKIISMDEMLDIFASFGI